MTTTPTKNESLPELVARWRDQAKAAANGPMFDGASEYAVAGTYSACADELEAALTREAPTEGVAWHGRYKWSSGWSGWLLFTNKKAAEDFAGEYEFEIRPLYATPPAPQRMAQGERPSNCRMALRDAGKAYPRSGCAACGDGGLRGCPYERTAQPPHQDRGEVEQRARELLSEEWKRDGHPALAHSLLNADLLSDKNPAIRAITAALTEAKQQNHGAEDHGIEQAAKAKFVPCDCGCGRSCCAHCGNDVGFVAKQQGPGEAVAWIPRASLERLSAGWSTTCYGPAWAEQGKEVVRDAVPLYTAPQVEAKRQTGEGESTVPEEKAESVCVHCFSPPYNWGMVCCKSYYNDPRTEKLTATQAKERRAAAAKPSGGDR